MEWFRTYEFDLKTEVEKFDFTIKIGWHVFSVGLLSGENKRKFEISFNDGIKDSTSPYYFSTQ